MIVYLIDEWKVKYWFKDNQLHRPDGPAVECPNGITQWYQDGKPHRLNGPALDGPEDSHKYWYIEGVVATEQEFNQLISK
jgi:hypothetical protein